MGDLLAKIVPLAIGAAFSPTVLAVELLILSAPKRALARASAYVLGVVTVLLGLTVVGLRVTDHGTPPGAGPDPVTRAIDGTLGFVLLLLALRTVAHAWATRGEERDSPEDGQQPGRFSSLPASFGFGIVMMLSNFSTILLYLPALRAVNAAQVDVTQQVVAVAILFVITVTPIVAPIVVRVVAPGPAGRWLGSLHTLVTRYQTQLAVGVEVIFGVYLLVKAIRG